MNKDELNQIITEYKQQNGIESMTVEELLDLIPESMLFSNHNGGNDYYSSHIITDYEGYLLDVGINPFTGEYFDVTELPNYHIIDEFDTINPADVAPDLCWTDSNLAFEEALEQASILDRFYLIIDEKDNIIGSGLFDTGDNIEDYFRIKSFGDEYDFMKVEDPDSFTIGELECSLADDLEYHLSIRSKILDFSAENISEVIHKLKLRFDETIYVLRIHLSIINRKFLITGTFEPDVFYYTINLVSEGTTGNDIIFLTDTTNSEYIPAFLEYYINTDFQSDLDFATS